MLPELYPTTALEFLLIEWTENPAVAVLFCAICLIAAWRLVFLSKVRIVQKDRKQNAEIALDVARMRTVVDLAERRNRKVS